MSGTSAGIVLFLPLSNGNLLEMLPVAKAMREAGTYEPVLALDAKVASLMPLADGMKTVRTDGSSLNPRAAISPDKSPETENMTQRMKPASPKQKIFLLLPSFFQSLLLFRSEKRRAQRLFGRLQTVSLVIVAGDRNIGIETAVIAEAHRRNIPSLIVPFAMSFPEASAEPRLRTGPAGGKYGTQTIVRKILARLFPSWIWIYKGVPLFFQPPSFAVAAWMLGMMPAKPWMIGGGLATKMAVESDALHDQLRAQGMPAEKMIVTGKPGLDDIARQIAVVNIMDIRKKLGIAPEEKVILCSVPNFAEHDLLPWDRHLIEMQFLFDGMAKTGAKVILNLHPRSDRTRYQPLADKAGLTISDERVYSLLPACDILVTSYSSTVAQAIALCKPSVVVDFYGFEYPVYDHAPGAIVLKDRETFFPTLRRLLTDAGYYESNVREQRKSGAAWAMLDGKNTERVMAVATRLISLGR